MIPEEFTWSIIGLKFKYMLYYYLYKADELRAYVDSQLSERDFLFLFFYETPYDVSNSLLVTNSKNATDY